MPKRGGPRRGSGPKHRPIATRRTIGKDPPASVKDFEPTKDIGVPPDGLSKAQLAKWMFAIDNAPPGLLRIFDRDILLSWVVAAVEIEEAEVELRKTGLVVDRPGTTRTTTSPNGTVTKIETGIKSVISPVAKARNEAFNRLLRATSELGFSPTSRARIAYGDAAKKDTNRFTRNKK